MAEAEAAAVAEEEEYHLRILDLLYLHCAAKVRESTTEVEGGDG